MSGPASRCRRIPPLSAPITMDLLGVDSAGKLWLWQASQKVQPLTRLSRKGGWIQSGHYVIEHQGASVVVHLANATDGRVIVQHMCSDIPAFALPFRSVASLVLGRVIPDPVEEATLRELIQEATEALLAKQRAPHRGRGNV